MIRTDKLNTLAVYEPGTDPLTWKKADSAIRAGEERIERQGNELHVYMSSQRSHFTPDVIQALKGDTLFLHITNIEQTADATHGFAIPQYNVEASVDPGEAVTIQVALTREGTFAMYCSEFCSALHLEMQGWLEVAP
jgi:nitrous-oxide reductase